MPKYLVLPFVMKIREVFSIMKEWIGRICLWRCFKMHKLLDLSVIRAVLRQNHYRDPPLFV